MIETQLEQIQQPVSVRVVIPNDREYQHAENTMTTHLLDTSFIVKVEKYGDNNRGMLGRADIGNLANLFNLYQGRQINSEVINLFQLNKGERKTARELEVIHESQISSNSMGFTFQEETRRQNVALFSQQLNNIIPRVNDKKIYVVLEIESKNIRQKIDYALSVGIRNFILRGGKWNNQRLWVEITSKIYRERGITFVSLPKRMRSTDKMSYIKLAFQFGADYVFHEVMTGHEIDEVLHLTSEYIYVSMPLNVALMDYADVIQEEITESQNYGFSRVRAINIANSFVGTIERIQL